MSKSDLTKRLSNLGYPLLEASEEVDANLTLSDLVKSQDLRLWEGFPEVLAFCAETKLFDYNKTEAHFTSTSQKSHFGLLLAMSLALYKALDLKFGWTNKLYKTLSETGKKQFKNYFQAFKNGQNLRLGDHRLSPERLKATFANYFKREERSLKGLLSQKEELGLELALSEVFSPKQKELFLKKLKGEKMSKTEKEYFSRAVKKKVLALANSQLHRLSQKLLE